MAHIEYDLDVLNAMAEFGDKGAKKLYDEKKAYLDSLKKKKKTTKKERERSPSPKSISHNFDKKKNIDKDVGTIMKGKSDLIKKGDKYSVDTEMNIKEGLEPKVKRALKKSIIDETNKKIKGYKKPIKGLGVSGRSLNLDSDISSSSDDETPKKKVDIRELKNYAKMLSHLLEHIEDPKEPIDKKDYKDAKRIIGDMEKVKRGRGRPKKC